MPPCCQARFLPFRWNFFSAIATGAACFALVGCGGGSSSSAETSLAAEEEPAVTDVDTEMDESGGHDAKTDPTLEEDDADFDLAQATGGPGNVAQRERGEAEVDPEEMEVSNDDGDDEAAYEAAMAAEYAQRGASNGAPGSGNRLGQPRQSGTAMEVPGRSVDVSTWSDAELLTAVTERDSNVVNAIQVRAEMSQGDPKFVELMNQVLVVNNGGMGGYVPPVPGEPSFPRDYDPNDLPGADGKYPVPPAGAQLTPESGFLPALNQRAVTSIEAMLGSALLAFVPQSEQSTRRAAENLRQNATLGSTAGSSPGSSEMSSDEMTEEEEMLEYKREMANEESEANGTRGPNGQPPSGDLTDDQLLSSVVRALIINDTDPAWKTLTAIVQGRAPSPVPAERKQQILITEIAQALKLNAKAANRLMSASVKATVANDEIPESLKLLTAIGGTATDHFMQLDTIADHTTEPPPPGSRPRNAPGMNAMMERGSSDEDDDYDESMGPDYGGGPNRLNRDAVDAGLPTVNVSAAALPTIANSLWSPTTVDTIVAHLDEADASASLDLLALATVIPSEKVRHSVFKLFTRLYETGATGMVQSGLFRSMAKDPGMLTVIKALPRARSQKYASRTAAPANGPKESWTQASLDLVQSLRDRLRKVENDPAFRYDGRQPVPLHDRNAVPEVAIVIDSATGDSDILGDSQPSPTKIYYTRLTISLADPTATREVSEHYEKRSNGIKREIQSLGLLWYDGVKKSPNGSRQSIDVMIEKAKAAPAGFAPPPPPPTNTIGGRPPVGAGSNLNAPTGPQYTIEIVVVSTRDPREAPE